MSFAIKLYLSIVLFVYLAIPALLVIRPVARDFGASWAVSIFLMTIFAMSIGVENKIFRAAFTAMFTVFVLLNTVLAISFVMQGVGFNTSFMTHLDFSTLDIAIKTDTFRTIAAGLYVLLAPFVAWAAAGTKFSFNVWPTSFSKTVKVLLLTASIVFSYPLQSFALHYWTTSRSSVRLLAEISRLQAEERNAAVSIENPKNIVLIYLEGVEQNYHDPDLFPDLMPFLTAKRNNGLWFSNVHQFPGTGWTIAGIVSSQCGVPLLSDGHGNQILSAIDNPFEGITCLGEYLSDLGFSTAFVGGASLNFAGKGNFLRDNGYQVTLGLNELPNSAAHDWGMFDADLYGHAKGLFDGLVDAENPFLLTVLTLDTHHPEGIVYANCAPYRDGSSTMLNAVHCADILLADFFDHIQASSAAENTIVAIVSDHLLINGSVKKLLETQERRITFIALDASRPVQRITGDATHFDIGPTLMDLAGMPNAEFAFGQSLLSSDIGRAFEGAFSEEDFAGFKVEQLARKATLRDGLFYDFENEIVSIGSARFRTTNGFEHRSGQMRLIRSQSGAFLAMYFTSLNDKYPDLFWDVESLDGALQDQQSGLILVVGNNTEYCIDDKCEKGTFMMLKDLDSGVQIVRRAEGDMRIHSSQVSELEAQ